jgi:hypothetical protein
MPTPLVRYLSRPNGVRTKGSVPHRTALDAYNKAYFNHSHHYFLDVKTLKKLPQEWMRDGSIAYANAYYGNYNAFVPGGPTRHVDLRSLANGSNWMIPKPRDGHIHPWNGWSLDSLHSYCQPGLAAMFCNSPAHMVSGVLRSYAHVMAQLGAAPATAISGEHMMRHQAWRFLHHIVMWKVATNHDHGLDREIVEQRAQLELEAIYDREYKPAILDNDPSPKGIGMRFCGQELYLEYSGGNKYYRTANDSKIGYHGLVLMLARQTGFWKAMRLRSSKCDAALRFLLDCHDKSTVDMLYYTKGRGDWDWGMSLLAPVSLDSSGKDISPDPVPFTSWADYVAAKPVNDQETLMTNSSGNPTNMHMGATNFLRIQWAFLRRDFFPDIPQPHVEDVCNMAQTWLDNFDVYIKSISSKFTAINADLAYVYPPAGVVKAPDFLVPI